MIDSSLYIHIDITAYNANRSIYHPTLVHQASGILVN